MQKVPEEDKSAEEAQSPPLENIKQFAIRQKQMATTYTSMKSDKKKVQFSSLEDDKDSEYEMRLPSHLEIPEATNEN